MYRDGNWTIAFFNPGKNPGRPDVFGCATLGAVDAQGAHDPEADDLFVWRREVPGRAVFGSRAQCLAELESLAFSPACIIALLAEGEGAEAFLEALRARFPGVAIAGGVSACAPGCTGELSPGGTQAALLLMRDSSLRAAHENILAPTGRWFDVRTGEAPRILAELAEGGAPARPAAEAWRALQEAHGLSPDNFEQMTLADGDALNVHLSVQDGRLCSGADCAGRGPFQLRYSARNGMESGMQSFSSAPGALIFGCAGLKVGVRQLPGVPEGTLLLFLFGEIADGRFANLMMTGLFPTA